MSVISNFLAMPNRIAMVCDYLANLGGDGASDDALVSFFSPIKKPDSNEEKGNGKTITDDVIIEMDRLGIVRRQASSNFVLSHEALALKKTKAGNWLDALRPLLRERLTSSDPDDIYRQSDFGEAIAWLLFQNALAPTPWAGGDHVQRIVKQLGDKDALRIGNDASYQAFLYWARYLGFVELLGGMGSTTVVPDPTSVLQELLPSVFRDDDELAIQLFFQRLAEVCPVFELGSMRTELEVRVAFTYQRQDRHLSSSTSLALIRLELRHRLKLLSVSDAESWALDLGKDVRSISHVRFLDRSDT